MIVMMTFEDAGVWVDILTSYYPNSIPGEPRLLGKGRRSKCNFTTFCKSQQMSILSTTKHFTSFGYCLICIFTRMMIISITKSLGVGIDFLWHKFQCVTLDVSALKHIKCASPSVYWHSVKTFANSWQKSLPSGRREQKLGGGKKNTMIQIVSNPLFFS